MNLAESMKHVLKSRSQTIFTQFWKDDLTLILTDMKKDFVEMGKSGSQKVRELRGQSLKATFSEFKESAKDTVVIFKVVPGRIKDGFGYFQDDLLAELERLPEQKQKTIFCLKVIGALGGSTLSAFNSMRKGGSNMRFSGLRIRNAFTHYLVTEMVFKLSQVFILRILSEVEKELTDEHDKKNIRFFKDLLSDNNRLDKPELLKEAPLEPGDKALEIVEKLRNYLLTGKQDVG